MNTHGGCGRIEEYVVLCGGDAGIRLCLGVLPLGAFASEVCSSLESWYYERGTVRICSKAFPLLYICVDFTAYASQTTLWRRQHMHARMTRI